MIREIMTYNIISSNKDSSIKEISSLMKEHNIALDKIICHAPYIINTLRKDVIGEPHLVLIGLNRILSGLEF